ncbi:MAG TPA: hypothetical protein VFH73_17785 [Polyangia bacterium]|nr:hypothetical protein [Polyangia bacterium]
MTVHPGRNVLERFSVGDLPQPLGRETSRHVSDCASCRGYLDELDAARAARQAAVPPELFVAQVANRRDRGASISSLRRRRRLAAGILTTAAAAAAVLLLIPRPVPQVALKGAGVAIHRNRGGQVHILSGDENIRAGDALRIVVTLPRPNQVAAWFVDANGRVDGLLAGATVSLPADEQTLPDSAIVKSPCLDLQLVVVVGARARAETDVSLRQAMARGIPAGEGWVPTGAITRTLRCE